MASQRATHVELLGRERTGADAGRVRLDYAVRLSDRTRRQTKTGADTADASRARGDERVRAKVEVEHERVGALDEDALVLREGVVHERDAVDDVRLETLGELLVAEDLAFGVIPGRGARRERERGRQGFVFGVGELSDPVKPTKTHSNWPYRLNLPSTSLRNFCANASSSNKWCTRKPDRLDLDE